MQPRTRISGVWLLACRRLSSRRVRRAEARRQPERQTPLGALVLLCALHSVSHAEVLDRIAVSVNQQVITESDLIRDLRVNAFIDQKPVDLTPEARRAAAQRLVDQILILKEAEESHLTLASPEDVARLVAQQKSKYPSEERYSAALAEYGITEADLSAHLLDGLRALRFTELRFRPEVQISDADLRDYYEKLAAGWRAGGRARIPTFEESRAQIENLLAGERTMKALDDWLKMARASNRIQYREPAFK
jgi:SurA N-terminal domain